MVDMVNVYDYSVSVLELYLNGTTSAPMEKIRVNRELDMLGIAGGNFVFTVAIRSDNETSIE